MEHKIININIKLTLSNLKANTTKKSVEVYLKANTIKKSVEVNLKANTIKNSVEVNLKANTIILYRKSDKPQCGGGGGVMPQSVSQYLCWSPVEAGCTAQCDTSLLPTIMVT